MLYKLSAFIATFMGSGLSPKAPGTMGSAASLPLAFLLAYFGGRAAIIWGTIAVFFIGTWAVWRYTRDTHEKDPGRVVIDETAGQLMAFVLVAPQLYQNTAPKVWLTYFLGFVLFRLFDILKFGPVKWADTKLKNAWGVMLDDVFAGIFATIVLLLLMNRL